MTANSTQRAAELSALIARHSTLPPHQIAAHVLHLQRIARQLKAIAERQCNGYHVARYQPNDAWDHDAEERDKKRFSKLVTHADDNCRQVQKFAGDFKIAPGGDPRGPCLRLLIEGERGDGFDQASDGTGSYAVY